MSDREVWKPRGIIYLCPQLSTVTSYSIATVQCHENCKGQKLCARKIQHWHNVLDILVYLFISFVFFCIYSIIFHEGDFLFSYLFLIYFANKLCMNQGCGSEYSWMYVIKIWTIFTRIYRVFLSAGISHQHLPDTCELY